MENPYLWILTALPLQKSSKAIVLSVLVHHISRNFQFSWSYLLIFSRTAGAVLVLEFEKSPKYLQIHVGRDGLPGAPHWAKVSYLIQRSKGCCTNSQSLCDFLEKLHSDTLLLPTSTSHYSPLSRATLMDVNHREVSRVANAHWEAPGHNLNFAQQFLSLSPSSE